MSESKVCSSSAHQSKLKTTSKTRTRRLTKMATSQKPTKKRQQISQAGRTMFTAVVVAALVFGVSMSISWHLFKKLQFNNLVITDLKETNKTATNNLKAAESLDKAV